MDRYSMYSNDCNLLEAIKVELKVEVPGQTLTSTEYVLHIFFTIQIIEAKSETECT